MWLIKTILAFWTPLIIATDHDSAHALGKQLYLRYGLPGITRCKTNFAFGCHHGLAENALVKHPEYLLPLAKTCERLGAPGSGPHVSCIHGLGHGVAGVTSQKKLPQALSKCNKLVTWANYCHDGVFMEGGLSDWKFECGKLPSRYRAMCWRNMPAIWYRQGLPWSEIIARCPHPECIASIGRQIAQISQGNPDPIKQHCPDIKCITVAAGEVVFQNLPNWPTKVEAICANNIACLEFSEQVAKDYAISRTTDQKP